MRFDTRSRKPTVWNILVLTISMIAVTAGLFIALPDYQDAFIISIAAAAYLTLVIVMLVTALIKQLQYNPYSYNTIYYIGFAIFILSVLITDLAVIYNMMISPGYLGISDLIYFTLSSGHNYILFSSPFILVFSAALFVSNIVLIRHEGKSLVNVMGIVLSFLLVFGAAGLIALGEMNARSFVMELVRELVTNLASVIYLYVESMLIGTIIANAIVVRHVPEPDKDYVIILGCAIRKDGTPTPLLQGRIDRAIAWRDMQLEKTGKDVIFITSGGQGDDEIIPESTSMRRYLEEHGVPPERIIEEDKSTNTLENMRFSKAKILERGEQGKILFVTTNYHVFRSGTYARLAHMRAIGIGSGTKWYFWPNAAVREFISLLTEHRLKQVLVFGGMVALCTLFTIMTYIVFL